MTDPLNVVASLASLGKASDPVAEEAAKAAASLWEKVLGPPSEALGSHLKKRVELWSEDALARRVLERAAQKADTSQPGSVPPRVAAGLFEQAQWADNEFVAEYLSGVLATARTTEGVDDRAVSWTAMVSRLSSDALRLHYVVYTALRKKLMGQDADVISHWTTKQLVFTYLDLVPRVDFGDADVWTGRLIAAAYTLEREGLLTAMTHGGADHLTGLPYRNYQLPVPGDMLITATTVEGCRLYLQAHGLGDRWASAIGDADTAFEHWPGVAPAVASVPATWLEDLPRAAG
ncbi:hypothetical protein [Agrococcus baldri]|nr:hypothetical protein [Agrococcus baldri]